MYQNQRILAIIPARGGSKGIPHKNIKNLHGHPLIAYSIAVAKKSSYIDTLVVSTDDSDIQNIAIQYGAEAPFIRPKELSSDTARTIDCILHAIQFYHDKGSDYDYVLLLQPTQPIRKAEWLDIAISKLIDSGEDSLVSVCPVSEHPVLMRTIEDGHLKNLLSCNSTIRRQDFPDYYRVNGSIYINRISIMDSDTSLNDNRLPYVMDSDTSIDIDTEKDFRAAEQYLNSHLEFQI